MRLSLCFLVLLFPVSVLFSASPNILFCISDDQSYAHTGATGDPVVKTPAFDRVAREGILFTHAFCDAPTCGPSRSAILTGQPIWRLEEAGNIHSTLPKKFLTYAELLKESGYATGFTGKGWSPGRLAAGGRDANPAGQEFKKKMRKPPFRSMSNKDYASNFEDFLGEVKKDQPFCFWLGTSEPHRAYELGAGKRIGKDPGKVIVPPIFPDNDIVRNDILDYLVEIETFDQHVARAIAMLESTGQLDNTIVVITSDHGMPFPRCKGQAYESSNHIPMAAMWSKGINGKGRIVEDYVSFADLAPTFLEVARIENPAPIMQPITGRSLTDVFNSPKSGQVIADRDHVLIGKERHDVGRPKNGGYPIRGIVKGDKLYLRNYETDRWPGGNPETGYLNCDGSPTKTVLLDQRRKGNTKFWQMNFGKRPPDELYDLKADPDCVKNLAETPAYFDLKSKLSNQMEEELTEQGDPRQSGNGKIFDSYPFIGPWNNFFENFTSGKKTPGTGWVSSSDYEKGPLD